MTLTRLCKTICNRHLLYDVTQGWRTALQEEFEPLRSYFRPMDRLARLYPGRNEYESYRIVIHRDGTIVGIDDEDDGNRLHLTRSDIVLYEFDHVLFRHALCDALGFHPCVAPQPERTRTIPVGTWEPEKAARFPVHLLLPGMFNLRDKVLERIVEKTDFAEILLMPPRNQWNDSILHAAQKNNILLVPLDEAICLGDGKIVSTSEWNEYLTALCKMVEMDLPSTLRKRPEGNLFAKRGEWIFRFSGREMLLNGELQGPAFMRRLMMTPHREVHVEQLWKEVFGNGKGKIARTEEGAEGDWNAFLSPGEEVLDAAGKTDYRNRLLQLKRDRAEAESENDIAWLERIDAETEAISAQLLKTVDGKGRPRKIGDEKDKLRKRISKNVTKAISMIADNHRELGEHLKSSISMGEHMAYRPSGKVEWSFE
ncbi:MAG TPA: hypothetical protein DEB39_15975 [Planctomycetaceae bacterium]|nr:hypothetical protein [Planctomycetaceae bacterium]